MHTDRAVQPTAQAPRTRAPNHTTPAAPGEPRPPRLLRAFFSPLRWYVTEGRTPVVAGSIEVGHLPRPRLRPEPAAETAHGAARLPRECCGALP
ncbi:MAG TPA: hypothetical protein VF142_15810 [Longimicrobium sp.]